MNALKLVVWRGLSWLIASSLPGLFAAAEFASNLAGHGEGAITLPATPQAGARRS